MVIIIEGLDGVGKSTICERLSADTKTPHTLIHEGYPGEKPGERLIRFENLKKNVQSDDLFYYDRCTCIDDFVYDLLNENKSELSDKLEEIKKVLRKCLIIHLNLDEKTHIERFRQRGDAFIKEEMLEKLDKRYSEFYKDINVIRFDLTDSLDNNVKIIEQLIEEELNND